MNDQQAGRQASRQTGKQAGRQQYGLIQEIKLLDLFAASSIILNRMAQATQPPKTELDRGVKRGKVRGVHSHTIESTCRAIGQGHVAQTANPYPQRDLVNQKKRSTMKSPPVD